MREIKFRQPHLNIREEFIDWFYWGFTDEGGFTSPLKLHLPNYQYTGLSDEQGKEIYEGDILEVTSISYGMKIGQVVFLDSSFIVDDGDSSSLLHVPLKLKVIGNIYENPELLT